MTQDEVLQVVVAKTREVFPQAQKLLLFGSRARGDARPDSDYDLMVITPLTAGQRHPGAALRLALFDVDASFDIIVQTPAQFALLCASSGYYQRQVLQESRVLHEAA